MVSKPPPMDSNGVQAACHNPTTSEQCIQAICSLMNGAKPAAHDHNLQMIMIVVLFHRDPKYTLGP